MIHIRAGHVVAERFDCLRAPGSLGQFGDKPTARREIRVTDKTSHIFFGDLAMSLFNKYDVSTLTLFSKTVT